MTPLETFSRQPDKKQAGAEISPLEGQAGCLQTQCPTKKADANS